MSTTETKERKRTGRPRKYGQGRISSLVRHTPERYAELKAAAEEAGRSISEQVEFELEDYRRVGPRLDKLDRDMEAHKAGQDKLVAAYEAKIKRFEAFIDKGLGGLTEGFQSLTDFTSGLMELQERILAQLQADRTATDERIARTVADAVAHAFERRKQ
jgi:hypothetical protein